MSNYCTFINLSHYPRLLPHLAHRCQTTAQASSWSPSPKDFQLLWSTHYSKFSFLTLTFILRVKKKIYANSYYMKDNKKRIKFNSYSGRFKECSRYNFIKKFHLQMSSSNMQWDQGGFFQSSERIFFF